MTRVDQGAPCGRRREPVGLGEPREGGASGDGTAATDGGLKQANVEGAPDGQEVEEEAFAEAENLRAVEGSQRPRCRRSVVYAESGESSSPSPEMSTAKDLNRQ
jgi:hypothetical protein